MYAWHSSVLTRVRHVGSSQCNRPITDKLRTINVGIGFNGISLFITRRGVLAPVEEYKCVVARQPAAPFPHSRLTR